LPPPLSTSLRGRLFLGSPVRPSAVSLRRQPLAQGWARSERQGGCKSPGQQGRLGEWASSVALPLSLSEPLLPPGEPLPHGLLRPVGRRFVETPSLERIG